ncbi:ribbon-helix-helix protein, CopG family [Labedella populi]|uniref:Ribbon-helix-helix protein, CopG family n=1 Tax=Labedella populi TaxID=2498850 RepID=A0A3S3ZJQ1_9MICO|nr:ribbon-helix-helix protein, CopG family [Labedella populi]RWZ58443.1 ribbon-helix-helix protein, CopG family [Labedella populi]
MSTGESINGTPVTEDQITAWATALHAAAEREHKTRSELIRAALAHYAA